MQRMQSWPEDLAAYLDTRRDMPFAWGYDANDCWSCALGAVEAMTGERPPSPVYADAMQAARLLDERSLRLRAGDLFAREIAPAFAQRGDVVLMLLDGRETLGVWDGEYAAAPAENGLALLPRSTVMTAWRV